MINPCDEGTVPYLDCGDRYTHCPTRVIKLHKTKHTHINECIKNEGSE